MNESDREALATNRLGVLFDLPEPEAPMTVHTFDGPHEHRCQHCGAVWTHRDRVCHSPGWFTKDCPACR